MIASTLIAAIGLGISAVGVGTQVMGMNKAADASQRAEDLRQQQMNLDTARTKRQIIRQSILARSQAVSSASSQGAMGGSALPGAYAGISGSANNAMTYNNQSSTIGGNLFDANRDQTAGQTMSSMGQGISNFGNMVASNSETINRLGTYFGSRYA